LVERSYPAGWMAVVHLFCTVVLVGIGQNWGDCNTFAEILKLLSGPLCYARDCCEEAELPVVSRD